MSSPSEGRQAPYFFLSYAHTPGGESSVGNPNKWVYRFFDELCRDILEMTALRRVSEVGFLDQRLQGGHSWSAEVSRALATCKVFVPLFSPRYFESESCGKEWSVIQARLRAHHRDPPPVILPVIWYPVESSRMPPQVHEIQYADSRLGTRLQGEGLYSLIKISSRRQAYRRTVLELARRIIQAAELSPLCEAASLPDYSSFDNAFADYRAARTMEVFAAAPDLQNLPRDRDPYYYGRTSVEWNPFRNKGDHEPIASRVASLLRAQGIHSDLGEQIRPVLAAEHPALILVDPWAVEVPDVLGALRSLSDTAASSLLFLVLWNHADKQTVNAEVRLRDSLSAFLGAGPVRLFAHDIASVKELQENLPRNLARTFERYLRRTPAHPPSGPVVKRPRLLAPNEFE
ncbi:TIR-like protein FxsC [Nonomuraea sp. PA05]|uniref:TIR-like protein FxsC n=1 Tax=Nonomuraea sp. PA05 TaxID=2604466 RepID=UPI0021CC4EF9|nr:TIR-like protein FxsC [Nonomuraea sp. PA05]